jgi:proteasome lid subunit RPN8/RPN11
MEFGVKKTIGANEVSNKLACKIYQDKSLPSGEINNDFIILEKLCDVFANRAALHTETAGKKFACYIEKKAFDAFVQFANETYQSRKHEATGLIVGYYLHDKDNPDSKFIVGTNFLPATGTTSTATCEFSYQDSIKHSDYCNAHKMLPLIWIHSHPGFGAFYSGTDDFTLKSYFYANHQTGVVVDNLEDESLGYKMYEDKRQEEDVFVFDLDKSNSNYLSVTQLNKKKKTYPSIDDDSKKKEEIAETEDEIKTNEEIKKEIENRVETIQRPEPNVIIWTFCILFVLFLVSAVAFTVNFKQTNDWKNRIITLENTVQRLDSISKSIAVMPTEILVTSEDNQVDTTKNNTVQPNTIHIINTKNGRFW